MHLEFALTALARQAPVNKVSSFFETEPVGYRNQAWFLNIAVEIKTRLFPMDLLHLCNRIETSSGRVRTFSNAPRTLDLDILLYDDLVMNEKVLIIPHPRLAERRFVLEPLAQIAPELLHPVLKKSMRSLLEECRDTSEVRLLGDRAL
jgi:2-amino-4-hydroxy-6-hydroxymethyldihydropteridine diphosphokinase